MLQEKSFNFSLLTNVRFGINVVKNELAREIQYRNKKKVFIATDAGLVKTGLVDTITTLLSKNNIGSVVFSEVEPNPRADTVMRGAALYTQESCDMILAIGGGSSIDFAKAVGVVATCSDDILDYSSSDKEVTNSIPLLFAIPTTVGSGSEVTRAAVITDSSVGRKFIVASPLLVPKMAFIDPLITISLPKQHVAATSLDALVHAIESYTSARSTPIADGLAIQAISMIKENLTESYENPENLEARSQIQLASTIAGIAFSQAGLGLVHSCSHPMSGVYNVAHGIANAIFLPYVIEYNLSSNIKKYANISRIFRPELVLKDDQTAANELPAILRTFISSVNIPNDFGYLGIEVTDEVIERLANDAMEDKSIPSNPRKVIKEDVIKIYNKVLPR